MKLAGKVAIVTGAGTGIGAGTALVRAEEGAAVTLFDPHLADLETVQAQIRQNGGRSLVVQGDVSLASDVERLMRTTVEAFQGLNILFNNAGIMINKTVLELSEEEWDRIIAVNLRRLGTPQDVAKAVVWLASDDASFTTGSPLYVDGGILAQL